MAIRTVGSKWHLLAWLLVFGSPACSQHERAPLLQVNRNQVGQGGSTGDGGVDSGGVETTASSNVSAVPSPPATPEFPLGAATLGRFDPDEVYIATALYSEVDAQILISHWSQPTVAVGYLPRAAWFPPKAFIRRTDGRLLYLTLDGDLLDSSFFEADEMVSAPFAFNAAVTSPEANDEVATGPAACDWFGTMVLGNSFTMSYDGRIITECLCPGNLCKYVDDKGTDFASYDYLSMRGDLYMDGRGTLVAWSSSSSYDRIVLAYDPKRPEIQFGHLDDPEPIVFFRPLANGFLYGVGTSEYMTLKVWVPPATIGEVIGVYPPAPADMGPVNFEPDGYGNVYYVATFAERPKVRVLFRATPGATEPERLFETEDIISIISQF